MADPHHVETLDAFDRGTVRLYRLGLLTGAVSLFVIAAGTWTSRLPILAAGWWWLAVGATIAALNLHLYARTLRWVILHFAGLGLLTQRAAGLLQPAVGEWVRHVGGGLLLAVFAALALKERTCFRLPLTNAAPPLLVLAIFADAFGPNRPAAALYTASGAVLLVIAIAKLRMPLTHDIGDKSRYQI